MTTTLTREALLDRAKPKYAEVEVPGWGTVGVREVSQLLASKRAGQMFDDNGKLKEDVFALRNVHMIIDQLMVDEDTPMFTEADIPVLSNLGASKLNPLLAVIANFNDEATPQKKGESTDSSESLEETTA